MNAKFSIIAIAAAMFAASAAYADQPFGRDSVRVTPNTTVSKSTATAPVARFGRDSVYVTPGTSYKAAPAVQTAGTYKIGRA